VIDALTLHEAAELLGVHYMTVYRYVRLGLLPATKVGGTWQVAPADVESYRSGAEAVEPGARRRAPWAARLEARLVAGDNRGAWGVIEAALAAGAEVDEVYLQIISPAMQSIGARWAAGELDVSVEHRATGIAFRLIGRLGPRFARRGRTRGVVLLGAPVGERHSLPIALLADLLRGEGWDVSDLGVDMPAASFVHAALDTDALVAIGVSVTNPEHLPAASVLLAELRAALPDVFVVVGGLAIEGQAHALALGADGWAGSARGFADQLSNLVAPVVDDSAQ
jgi:excisionase family DNA binding protein